MNTLFALLILQLIIPSHGTTSIPEKEKQHIDLQEVVTHEFQTIIDSSNVNGAILIFDLK